MGLISPVSADLVASGSDRMGRPRSARSVEIEDMLMSALESGGVETLHVGLRDGERFSSVASRVRAVAARCGARVYIRKARDNGCVNVLVMGRL